MLDRRATALINIHQLTEQIKDLEHARTAAVDEARSHGASWAQVGNAHQIPRQVAHDRYRTTAAGHRPVNIPGLINGASAHTFSSARHGTSTLQVTLADDATYTYDPAVQRWLSADGHAVRRDSIDTLLGNRDARRALEAAAHHALTVALSRHAGIQKRLETISTRGSKVGRPRTTRRPCPPHVSTAAS